MSFDSVFKSKTADPNFIDKYIFNFSISEYKQLKEIVLYVLTFEHESMWPIFRGTVTIDGAIKNLEKYVSKEAFKEFEFEVKYYSSTPEPVIQKLFNRMKALGITKIIKDKRS